MVFSIKFVRAFSLSFAALIAGNSASMQAANPELVGILATAVSPEGVSQLGLTEEQIKGLQDLIARRESQGIGLAQEQRQLPPEARAVKVKAFVRESEELGDALLDAQQRNRLKQMRLEKIGLISLMEPDIADVLELSPGQKEQVKLIIDSKSAIASEVGAARLEREMDSRLTRILSNSQVTLWKSMIGRRPDRPSAAAQPIAANDAVSTPATEAAKPAIVGNGANARSGAGQLAAMMANVNQAPADSEAVATPGEPLLTLNFKGASWDSVFKWLTEEAKLSMQYDALPDGSFTYQDTFRKYTVSQAMDEMNRALLSKGFTLMRKNRTLMVINLGGDPKLAAAGEAELMKAFLRETAELVTIDELDRRGEYEIVKCFFEPKLGPIDEAQREVTDLIAPYGSVKSLPSAGKLLVTETAGKLRVIRTLLEPKGSTKFVRIKLKYATTEEVLDVARRLVGIQDKDGFASPSDDISLSTDSFGNSLYITGTPAKVQIIVDLAKLLDVPPEDKPAVGATEKPIIKSHPVRSSDPQLALEVLQTYFAGTPNLRLALNGATKSIVANSTESVHKEIDDVLNSLAGSTDFTIIPVKRMDPQAVVATLERFFGKSDASGNTDKGPVYYPDTATRSVMVKGSTQQVEQIRDTINKIEGSNPLGSIITDNLRVIPLTGSTADRTLEAAMDIWKATKHPNMIRVAKPSVDKGPGALPQLSVPPAKPKPAPKAAEPKAGESKAGEKVEPKAPAGSKPESISPSASAAWRLAYRYVGMQVPQAEANDNQEPEVDTEDVSDPTDIRIISGPTGMIITSEDKEALADFEKLLLMVSGQFASEGAKPTVVWLQHVTAAAAAELLNGLMNGQSGNTGSGVTGGIAGIAGQLLGGGGQGGGLLGPLLGGGATSTTTGEGIKTGNVTITSDPRLNMLFIYANPTDMETIRQLLVFIDKEDSEVAIQALGETRFIKLNTADVEEVAGIIRTLFATQINGGTQAQQGGGGAGGQAALVGALLQGRGGRGGARGGRGGAGAAGLGGGGAASQLRGPSMLIATDVTNNTLIVTSSTKLYEEVLAIVKQIDEANDDRDEITTIYRLQGNVNPELIQLSMQSILGDKVTSNYILPIQSAAVTTTGRQGFGGAAGGRAGGAGAFGAAGGRGAAAGGRGAAAGGRGAAGGGAARGGGAGGFGGGAARGGGGGGAARGGGGGGAARGGGGGGAARGGGGGAGGRGGGGGGRGGGIQ